jgi:PIN domain nuclease of toxin-antitoxin system
MKLLLDTQILIWILEDNPKLTTTHRNLIQDSNYSKWVSHFSFMELAIKLKLKKLPNFIINIPELIDKTRLSGLMLLPILESHFEYYDSIPFYEDHRDPFDRFILATALCEGCAVISSDEKFSRYKNIIQVL